MGVMGVSVTVKLRRSTRMSVRRVPVIPLRVRRRWCGVSSGVQCSFSSWVSCWWAFMGWRVWYDGGVPGRWWATRRMSKTCVGHGWLRYR